MASQAARQLRARTYHRIREFFEQREVMEVETPMLSLAANTDPNIDSFQCPDQPGAPRFLRTSPEFPLKRLLAAGSGAIYEMGRVFRQAELGGRHNPEFTMLEWYRPGFDLQRLMDEVVALLRSVSVISEQSLVSRCRYRDLVLEKVGLDPLAASDDELNSLVNKRGWFDGRLDRSACLDLVMSLGVVPGFKAGELMLVHDFPACQAALAIIDPDDPDVAQRFEAYFGQLELANGYQELCEPIELGQRFEAENRQRRASGKPVMPRDEWLLGATGHGIEACSGVALGVDRLLMALDAEESLQAVLNFPWERA